jgi:hypothetical protein
MLYWVGLYKAILGKDIKYALDFLQSLAEVDPQHSITGLRWRDLLTPPPMMC